MYDKIVTVRKVRGVKLVPFRMHELRELIRLIDESRIDEFQMEKDGAKVIIKKGAKEQPAAAVTVPTSPEKVEAAPKPAYEPAPAPSPQVAPSPAAEPKATESKTGDDAQLHKIVSPMVGTFYRAPAPDADPYVQVGDRVDEKTVVCIIEAMKLMNEIEAEVRGEIVDILVENGQLVEYGQPLFLVKTE
jgi:acetyl-CoA carboxylase biotin carboxyl carrier protein